MIDPYVTRNPFTFNDDLFMGAAQMGCWPAREDSHNAWWTCTCPNRDHGTTINHPIITSASLDRAKAGQ